MFMLAYIAMMASSFVSTGAFILDRVDVGIPMLMVTVIAAVLVYDEFLHMKKEGKDG